MILGQMRSALGGWRRAPDRAVPVRVPPATVRETAKTGIHSGHRGKKTKQTQFLASQLQSMRYGWFRAPRARLAKRNILIHGQIR